MRMSSKLTQLMRDLIRVCQLQAYEQSLPLTYLHAATNPLVLGILTHPDLPFVVLGYACTQCTYAGAGTKVWGFVCAAACTVASKSSSIATSCRAKL